MFSHKLLFRIGTIGAVGAVLAAGALGADLVHNFASDDPLRNVFWKSVPTPGGVTLVRKTPKETRPALAARADLRAMEAERDFDFAVAEADWKTRPPIELADFYHRRNRPADELQALALAAQQATPAAEKLRPAEQQTSWHVFQRIFAVMDASGMPTAASGAHYQAWMTRYPVEPSVAQRYFEYLVKQKQYVQAGALLDRYTKSFPSDPVFPVSARAKLAEARGNAAAALAVYDKEFDPLWPQPLRQAYFKLLNDHRGLRDFLSRARTATETASEDFAPVGRVYFYYQSSEPPNPAAARRALLEYRMRHKSPWKAAELRTLAKLFEEQRDYPNAAGTWKQLSEISGDNAAAEDGTAGLISVLLAGPEQPIAFGMGDLTFLRDVGTIDPYPGFFNGILSMLFNRSNPGHSLEMQQRQSAPAYFHRAAAAELLDQYETRFPQGARRAELRAALVDTYAAYGADAGVIAAGTKYLADFPTAPRRLDVALRMAESYARTKRDREEFALYDALLKELAERASGVPLGDGVDVARAPVAPPVADADDTDADNSTGSRGNQPASFVRSPEYARVLDRYVARLVSLKRVTEATALYRREIDRNPDDPGLYERLAAFLDQNRRATEIEAVYRRAMGHFPDKSWSDKLARWFLRQKRQADFERLTREVTGVFSGSELGSYFKGVVASGGIDPVMYRQLNLAAHDRFPNNLAFVHNLITAYSVQGTSDPAAAARLVHEYWMQDEGLRERYLVALARTGRLDAEVQAAKAIPANAGTIMLTAEAEIWQCHFEAAVEPYDKVVAEYPTETALVARAAMLHRSLAQPERAVALEQSIAHFEPRDHGSLTRAGEIYADRERYDLAAPFWNKIPVIDPGRPEGYLEAATIFWDYYRYDDALRVIREARTRLTKPTLYAFEAGAIYENRREYPRAITEYVRGAAATEEDSPARRRLVRLAHRKDLHDAVETAAGRSNSFGLRVALLNDDARRVDLEKYLAGLVTTTSSFELLGKIEQEATTRGMDDVRTRVIEREIAINKDPVEDMRLRLALVRFEESVNHIDAARSTMAALYRDRPTILGVVRASIDFEWRNKAQGAAVDTLVKAAAVSYPAQKTAFLFEAARKATEAKQFARARELLAGLLQEQPFSPEYLAAIADTFSVAGDDRGLRDFYTATLTGLRGANITPEERMSRTAAMRRGLIPALVRLNDATGALDQYIEIINRYPEDAGLAREAAVFAARNNLKARLIDYYTKTATASPRDFRWPMVLGRLQTQLEDFPSAVTSYTAALAIRPDRIDLMEARENLEERLLRFADELADDQRLYELRYHDPSWMEKSAEALARLGRNDEAVAALRKALIEGRPERPENYFAVARKLESWNMVEQALPFVDKGGDSADIYFAVKLRLRRYDEALAHMTERVPRVGDVVAKYYTAAEKTAFSAALEKLPAERHAAFLPLVEQAGLRDLQARWLGELMMAGANENEGMYPPQLRTLQTRRMKFDELGKQLEAYAAVVRPEQKGQIVFEAADAYRASGNTNEEFRVLDTELRRASLTPQELNRYLELIHARDPQRLIELARTGRGTELRNAAAARAVAGADPQLALRAVAARGLGISPVWTKAYTGVTGLYFADPSPEVNAAFTGALDTGTIGQRLAKQPDRNQQLVGDVWFYYGTRYGEYLEALKRPGTEDYLPAMLEMHPSSAAAFLASADSYAEKNNTAAALADYDHAVDLQPTLAAAHNRAAELLLKAGRRDEALARWRLALANMPPYAELAATLQSLKRNGVFADLRPDTEKIMHAFLHDNGAYRGDAVLQAAVEAGGAAWVVEMTSVSPDPLQLLGAMIHADWLPAAAREPVYQRILDVASRRVADTHGVARNGAVENASFWRMQWIGYLLGSNQVSRAEAEFAAMAREGARNLDQLELRIAAQSQPAKLDALFERYRREPEKAPQSEQLRALADLIRKEVSEAAAQRVLAFTYERDLDGSNPPPASFLGLAEVHLQRNDVPGAVALLRRVNLIADPAFEYLMPSAQLLEKYKRPAEAREFVTTRQRAVPWDTDARRTAPAPDPVAAALRAPDAAGRLRALLDLIAASPDDAAIRPAIVHAAFEAGRYALAVHAGIESGRSLDREEEYSPDQYMYASGYPWQQRAAPGDAIAKDVATDLARSHERLGDLNQAAAFFKIAGLTADRTRIEVLERRNSENAARQPVIKVALEQEHVVMPRRLQ